MKEIFVGNAKRILRYFNRYEISYRSLIVDRIEIRLDFTQPCLSRIHLKVKYDDLKSDAKSEVWRNFLSRACTSYGDPSISDDELKRLSNTHLNGREIRNTVATARKIAIRQESIVLFSHLKQAVAASKEFLSDYNGPDHVSSVFL
ncbi:uncharacterized protein K441DRAFT_210636 [Cenococcum geophilum 1.58]|uniref:uncharacterized protein n=1 Tax=Cenococcum geophilum 1.58 TaxID=794803 RepID=UPI00358E3D72|nr:hypothetical protein K441DRAFT_210636 [Cenococcum geophilum 1.58]